MKRKNMFVIMALSAVAAFAVFNVSIHWDNVKISDISLDNVEVLAQESSEPDCALVKGVCFGITITSGHLGFQ